MNNANNIMKQLPEEQRPYEKCFTQGESSLSDSELLAVILRSGMQGKNSLALAQEILKFMESSSYPGLMGLMHVSVQDLMRIHGVGRVKAVQLKCIGGVKNAKALMHTETYQEYKNRIGVKTLD